MPDISHESSPQSGLDPLSSLALARHQSVVQPLPGTSQNHHVLRLCPTLCGKAGAEGIMGDRTEPRGLHTKLCEPSVCDVNTNFSFLLCFNKPYKVIMVYVI